MTAVSPSLWLTVSPARGVPDLGPVHALWNILILLWGSGKNRFPRRSTVNLLKKTGFGIEREQAPGCRQRQGPRGFFKTSSPFPAGLLFVRLLSRESFDGDSLDGISFAPRERQGLGKNVFPRGASGQEEGSRGPVVGKGESGGPRQARLRRGPEGRKAGLVPARERKNIPDRIEKKRRFSFLFH